MRVFALAGAAVAAWLLASACADDGASAVPDAGDTDTDTDADSDTGEPDTDDSWCPPGQVCSQITESGLMGCLDDGEFPDDLTADCDEDGVNCPASSTCVWADAEQTESVCSTNCGTCPDGQTCTNVGGGGYFVCLVAEISIPTGAATSCHLEGQGCEGNATCFYTNSAHTASACIQNCSPCYTGTCPEGEVCVAGTCVIEPCDESSCADDEVCAGGLCIPDPGPGPGENPGLVCDLPPMLCEGDASYCGELVQFDPPNDPDDAAFDPLLGYIDYPENGETWDDQYRSWLRRDAVMMVQYAAAKTACYTDGWEFGNGDPIGLIDMSEEDGAIPGTSVGSPGHPAGTHTDGRDIDIAYFQAFTADNAARPVCDYFDDGVMFEHCTAPPHLLDPWRQAVFLGALFEHPDLRVIGADGKIGPVLEYYMDLLCDLDWIDPAACSSPPLAFEPTNMGWGWYFSHHHHIHVSYDPPDKGGAVADGPLCITPDCRVELLWPETELQPIAPVETPGSPR